MSDSKENLVFGQDIIDRWFEDGGTASTAAMLNAKTKLTESLVRANETEVRRDWLVNQNTFALWCLIEIELEQCPPKELRDLVFAMRGEHELWFGKLLFSLVIYLYESKTTPQTDEGVHVTKLHAVIWSEIMLLHSVLSAYNYNPEPRKFMDAKFGLADYQKLDERLKPSGQSKFPEVSRLLEELMGYGDPVAEFLLGLEEGYDSELIRDASDCGFLLASYYGALRADSLQKMDSSASSRISSKIEKEMLLRRLSSESVSEYLKKYENTLDGLSKIKPTEHPVSITEEDWLFFAGVLHHSQEMLGNPKAEGIASAFWLEAERNFDDYFEKISYPSLYDSERRFSKSYPSIKEQYDLAKRCEYRLQLAESIISYRKEYLFNLAVESAKLFEALLKACVVHFSFESCGKISKSYVSTPKHSERSMPTTTNDVPEKIMMESGREKRGRDYVKYARSGRDDFIAKECKDPASPALNQYIFEVLNSIGSSRLQVLEWQNGVLLTWHRGPGVLQNSCNVRSLLVAIALTAFVYSDHPFRSLWLPADKDGLKSLINEAYGLYKIRNQSGGAHFVPNSLGPRDVLEQVGKVFALADKVIEEVLIDI